MMLLSKTTYFFVKLATCGILLAIFSQSLAFAETGEELVKEGTQGNGVPGSSCGGALAADDSTVGLFSSKGLYKWNSELETLLTYRLKPDQISKLKEVDDLKAYKTWLSKFLSEGWSLSDANISTLPNYIFKALQENQLTTHEFMTGFLLWSIKKERGHLDHLELVFIDEKNIDSFIDQELIYIYPEHKIEFRRRALETPERERIFIKQIAWIEPREENEENRTLFRFSWFGGFIYDLETIRHWIVEYKEYPMIPPIGTRPSSMRKENKDYFRGTLLSASLRQVLSDVMHGDDSVQHTPVIGGETSFQMGAAIALGGRSILISFPGIKTHSPHQADISLFPLRIMLHDYFHNEQASHTPVEIRSTLVPLILRKTHNIIGRKWNNLKVGYSLNEYLHKVKKNDPKPNDFVIHNMNLELDFKTVQGSIGRMTDFEDMPWDMLSYFKILLYPSNFSLDPKWERNHTGFLIVGNLLEDMFNNPEDWIANGFDPKWISENLKDFSYRFQHLYEIVRSGEFASAEITK